MKKINLAIIGLTLSMLILGVAVFEQQSSAQSSNLGCQNINCLAVASCGGPGTPNGCNISCQNGATIQCDPKPKDGGGDVGTEDGGN
jgi:hypothetical protein